MRNTMLLLVAFAGISSCLAQVPGLGGCPKVETKADFEPAKYLGKWYEAERYFAVFEFGGKCNSANYSLGENGTIVVFNKMISTITGNKSNITGTATTDPKDPAKLSVKFPVSPVDAPYWVVDTDYDNYAVVWSCSTFGIFNTKFAWILTRNRQPMLDVMQNAYSAIDKNNISRAFFMRTNQQSCPDDF